MKKEYEPTKREIEIDRLKIAMRKSEISSQRVRESLHRIYDKIDRQKSELWLQTILHQCEKSQLLVVKG